MQKDIVHIEEQKKYIKDDNLINFDKIYVVQNILDEFFKFNEYTYAFESAPKFNFFSTLITQTEEELEKLSLNIEPKFKLYSKKKDNKRLTAVDKQYFSCNKSKM